MDSNIGYSQTQQHCHQNNSSPSIGFFNQETFRNDNRQSYSPSTSSEMDTMFTNSQQNQGLPNDFDALSLASENYENETETKFYSSMNCSNLIRHKSSPADFFSNYSLHNDFAGLREVGSVRNFDVSNGQATASASGLHGTLNLSSRQSSCSINMPQVIENEHEAFQPNCIKSMNIGNDNGSTKFYVPSFTNDYWATSTANNAEIIFSTSNALETQDVDFGYQKLGLSHHWSLPSSCTKMTSMDKFFHIQGSVPCKIRAKRGFATHPRSIAERERRIRISARIKKLQDLFPNSDKQSSTADMLDVAVDYIKDLRKQLKILSDTKAKCSCTSN